MNSKYILENSTARVIIDTTHRLAWWEVLLLVIRLVLENLDLFRSKDG